MLGSRRLLSVGISLKFGGENPTPSQVHQQLIIDVLSIPRMYERWRVVLSPKYLSPHMLKTQPRRKAGQMDTLVLPSISIVEYRQRYRTHSVCKYQRTMYSRTGVGMRNLTGVNTASLFVWTVPALRTPGSVEMLSPLPLATVPVFSLCRLLLP